MVAATNYVAEFDETSTAALTEYPSVVVPLMVINGWMLMQRKVMGGSVSFNQNWAEYRDGFGSTTGKDNYWLGLDKVYHLVQLGSLELRVEVDNKLRYYIFNYCMFIQITNISLRSKCTVIISVFFSIIAIWR